MDVNFSELRLHEVSRKFAETMALSKLTLNVKRGEFVALLGPSGCGKSTALHSLSGLLPLSSGRILLDDNRIDQLPSEKRGFGMVFQNYALFPHLNVRKNVAFGLAMRRMPKPEIRRRVQDALQLVRLSDQADKYPGQLSGGQQQRVAIARAVVFEPQVVLMDEPLSNLDAKLRHQMRGEIRRLHRQLRLTTIYVTHDQEEALSLADRLVLLESGQVQQVGSPMEIYTRPANVFVADFMGYRNRFEMRALGNDSTGHITLKGNEIELVAASRVGEGPVVVLARPEDFVVGEMKDNAINATVEEIEYQGLDFEITARTKHGEMLHVCSKESLDIGQSVTFGIRPDRLMVYNKNTGEADKGSQTSKEILGV